jgi:hypothetical protein
MPCRVLLAAIAASALVAAQAAEEPSPPPEQFEATLLILNAPRTNMARLRMTVERWSTKEERVGFLEALKSGGNDGLVSAMEKGQAGYLQVDDNLRWPIRLAARWTTDKGQKVRLATNRPISIGESRSLSRSLDYPIGFIELTLPPEGNGEGILIAAAQVEFDDQQRLQVRSMPQNTGPQRLTSVKRHTPKKKSD